MNKKEAILIFIFIAIIIILAIFYFQEAIYLAPNAPIDVRVRVGNAAPTIQTIDAIAPVVLQPAPDRTPIIFTFKARDANGASELNDLTAIASFTKNGETTRSSICTTISQTNKEKIYRCIVEMSHYDAEGTSSNPWQVTVQVEDLSSEVAIGTSTFLVNLLRDISISPNTVNLPDVAPEQTDILSTENTVVRNRGNYVGQIFVTASDLVGETNPAEVIPASNFRTAGSSAIPTVCNSGTALDNGISTAITSTNLPRGEDDGTSNIESIGYCLTSVPSISSQFYSATTTGGNAWTIEI